MTLTDPSVLGRLLRRLIVTLTIALIAYLFWRFQLVALPDAALSPLTTVSGGDQLLFDRRHVSLAIGDVVLVEQGGALVLARVAEPPPESERAAWPAAWHALLAEPDALWLGIDRPDHPGPASRDFGPVRAAQVRGRLVMAW